MSVCLYVCLSITGSAKLNECAQPVSRWVHAKYGGVGHQPLWRREEAAAKEASQTSAGLCNSRRREESKEVARAWRDHTCMCTRMLAKYVCMYTSIYDYDKLSSLIFMVFLGSVIKLICCLHSHCLPMLLFIIIVIKTIS